jgi:hypothetical protein
MFNNNDLKLGNKKRLIDIIINNFRYRESRCYARGYSDNVSVNIDNIYCQIFTTFIIRNNKLSCFLYYNNKTDLPKLKYTPYYSNDVLWERN